MQSSTRTREFDPESGPAPAPADMETADDAATAEVPSAGCGPSVLAALREQCAACGAAMATDQRYCVECGERRGPARVGLLDRSAQRDRARGTPAARRAPRRARASVNSTLIA